MYRLIDQQKFIYIKVDLQKKQYFESPENPFLTWKHKFEKVKSIPPH